MRASSGDSADRRRRRRLRRRRGQGIESQGSKQTHPIFITCNCTFSRTIVGKLRNNMCLDARKQLLSGPFSTMLPQDCLAEGLRATVSQLLKRIRHIIIKDLSHSFLNSCLVCSFGAINCLVEEPVDEA